MNGAWEAIGQMRYSGFKINHGQGLHPGKGRAYFLWSIGEIPGEKFIEDETEVARDLRGVRLDLEFMVLVATTRALWAASLPENV